MKKIIGILFFVFLFAGCGRNNVVVTTIDGFGEGTTYHIVIKSKDSVDLRSSIDSLFEVVVNSVSVFNDNSLISRFNCNETDLPDEHIMVCLEQARKVSEVTNGMYDITVMPLIEAWGFASKQGLDDPNVDSLLQFVGYDKISIVDGRLRKAHPNVQINLNSIAKGYTTDLISRLLESRGIEEYLVEVGGEIFCRGKNPKGDDWSVSIDEPFEDNVMPGAATHAILTLSNKGLATSGNYRNYRITDSGVKIVHTINPRTGRGQTSNLLSVTVVADNCMTADAYSTGLFASGLEESIRILEADKTIMGYLIYADANGEYQTWVSPGLKKHIKR